VTVIDAAPVLRKVTPTGVLVAQHDIPEAEWLALRRTGIGGSDVGALLGMSKYTSPYELYLDKRGELPQMPRSEALDRAARWGHLHEPLIAAEFSRRYGIKTRRVGLIRNVDDPWRLANLDRQVAGCPDGPCFLEIKNRSAYKAGEWGPSESDDGVPDTEALQTYHYLDVTGYGHCHVAVLINGNDDRYYRINRDPELAKDVREMEWEFWQRVINGDPPPIDDSAAVAELLAALWTAQAEAQREVDPIKAQTLIGQRAGLKEQIAAAETEITGVENQMKALLGDKEIAVGPDGAPLYTWKQNGNFAAKRFAAAHPELAAEYKRPALVLDAKALAADHPDIHRANRARVLRISGGSQ
jgi:putative phage-type endonuclease